MTLLNTGDSCKVLPSLVPHSGDQPWRFIALEHSIVPEFQGMRYKRAFPAAPSLRKYH